MKRYLGEEELLSLAYGAMYLGSGGGGDTELIHRLIRQALRDFGPVCLLSPFALPDEAWVVPVCIMGSPTVLHEKLPVGDELLRALEALQEAGKIRAAAVAGLEIGGMNALTPVLAAITAKLPLVDCDGMGRAFPELQMTTYHAFGVQASPVSMYAVGGQSHLIMYAPNFEVEREARAVVTKMGGWAAVALYSMQVKQLWEVAIPQSFSLAIRLGEAVRAAAENVNRVFAGLARVFHNSLYGKPRRLLAGKVVELNRRNVNDLLEGELVVEGVGYETGEQVEVVFRNEYLLVNKGGKPLVSVPDLICVLDADTGHPISIEELENHMQVWVIAVPSPLLLRHAKMLDVIGPAAFGLAGEFLPIEQSGFREGGEADVPVGD
ncbi:DUF917 domain-containing protein [Brevibacillus marinus]|uniref:DUF917 domain-containing protein n=1 Tax=Brevibacillus marinus TaxID=2496837 RepID=UPI000F824D72|nr:DUF917 domain-containing protein [Brevibacillus marinus]